MPYKNLVVRREDNTRRHKQQYNSIRSDILEHLGNRCVICGFDNPLALQIDHRNGGGTQERRGFGNNMRRYYKSILAKIKEGDESYRCLCANCNCIEAS